MESQKTEDLRAKVASFFDEGFNFSFEGIDPHGKQIKLTKIKPRDPEDILNVKEFLGLLNKARNVNYSLTYNHRNIEVQLRLEGIESDKQGLTIHPTSFLRECYEACVKYLHY